MLGALRLKRNRWSGPRLRDEALVESEGQDTTNTAHVAASHTVGNDLAETALAGWPYRTRTSMCKVKIHLFELSTMLGFTHASADRPVLPEE